MIGPLIVDIEGLVLTDGDRALLADPLIGGVILFSRNYSDPQQLHALIASLKNLPRTSPLLISVDHEGGRVQRFKTAFTVIPPMRRLGQYYDRNPQASIHLAHMTGWLLAAELRLYGIDYSYTPVLDIDYHVNTMIGDRTFHQDPHVIIALTQALTGGVHEAGMVVVGKHFPGHGAVSADSHLTLPIDVRELSAFYDADLKPYQHLIQTQTLDAIMTAHVIYSEIDPDIPCFSTFWLQRVLRQTLDFQGVIISDDLSMEGAAYMGSYPLRVQKALEAGCDLLLICNNREAVIESIKALGSYYVPDPLMQLRTKALYGNVEPDSLINHPYGVKAKEALHAFSLLSF